MLYIEIQKSLLDTQVCPLTCAFLFPNKKLEKKKSVIIVASDEKNKSKNLKTALRQVCIS